MTDARVILACRNRKKGEDAARLIQMQSQNSQVEVELLDLNSLKSVKDFADRIKTKYTRLDILINNAGEQMSILYNSSNLDT